MGLALGMYGFAILHQCNKSIKVKSHKVLVDNSEFLELKRAKLVGESFLPPTPTTGIGLNDLQIQQAGRGRPCRSKLISRVLLQWTDEQVK